MADIIEPCACPLMMPFVYHSYFSLVQYNILVRTPPNSASTEVPSQFIISNSILASRNLKKLKLDEKRRLLNTLFYPNEINSAFQEAPLCME